MRIVRELVANPVTRRDFAINHAIGAAACASDAELAYLLTTHADGIESEGRAIAPQYMREAARRLMIPK